VGRVQINRASTPCRRVLQGVGRTGSGHRSWPSGDYPNLIVELGCASTGRLPYLPSQVTEGGSIPENLAGMETCWLYFTPPGDPILAGRGCPKGCHKWLRQGAGRAALATNPTTLACDTLPFCPATARQSPTVASLARGRRGAAVVYNCKQRFARPPASTMTAHRLQSKMPGLPD
jgi:hypothetical protein